MSNSGEVRLDKTGFGEVEIYQNPELFCYGVDAVLLADFAAQRLATERRKVSRLVDLCTGNGIVPLILSHKTEILEIVGVELLKESYDLAEMSRKHNGLESRLSFENMDVLDFSALESAKGSFDAVTCNPPYSAEEVGLKSSNYFKAVARHESTAKLEDFIRTAYVLLKDKGSLFMVHRASRLVDIIHFGRKLKMEPKCMQLISGKQGQEPNLLLVQMVKNGGAEMKVLPQIYTREADESFSKDLLKVYERD